MSSIKWSMRWVLASCCPAAPKMDRGLARPGAPAPAPAPAASARARPPTIFHADGTPHAPCPSASPAGRVQEHFRATQREADRLLLEALPRLGAQVAALLDTEGFKAQMRADGAASDPARWHELQLLVATRLLTAQYAVVLTTLQLRIRLNIISRHYFVETALGAPAGTETLSNLTKRRFLAYEHLVDDGLAPLRDAVGASVRAHLHARRLDEPLSAEEFMALLAPARAQLEQGGANGETASHAAPVRAFLAEELRAVGAVAEGDQLADLVAEARAHLHLAPTTPQLAPLAALLPPPHPSGRQHPRHRLPAAAGARHPRLGALPPRPRRPAQRELGRARRRARPPRQRRRWPSRRWHAAGQAHPDAQQGCDRDSPRHGARRARARYPVPR